MAERLMGDSVESDICIIGAGPAGLSAAVAALERVSSVTVVDENVHPGGQIWRHDQIKGESPELRVLMNRLPRERVNLISSATVIAAPAKGRLIAETPHGATPISYQRLILATGARERFLPFPGWTLQNVIGVGGLQALVKGGLKIADQRIVIAGSGPLLLAVAAYLKQVGARVVLIAEQAPRRRLIRFGLSLFSNPARLGQALTLKRQLSGIPYLTDCYPVAADGEDKVRRVILQQGAKIWQVECDYFACSFHLLPNLELASLLNCGIEAGRVVVDNSQRTSEPDIYSAGEATGVGGLELSILEGRIAGYMASGNLPGAARLFRRRDRARRFARLLDQTFASTAVLRELPSDQTIVCRCEDVALGSLREHRSWKAAKLQSRCGMGSCQGRICGPAVEMLLGWQPDSVRPPALAARLDTLLLTAELAEGQNTQEWSKE